MDCVSDVLNCSVFEDVNRFVERRIRCVFMLLRPQALIMLTVPILPSEAAEDRTKKGPQQASGRDGDTGVDLGACGSLEPLLGVIGLHALKANHASLSLATGGLWAYSRTSLRIIAGLTLGP